MPRGTTLSTLRTIVKAEIAASSVPTLPDARMNQLLNNIQQLYATEYDWAFLNRRFDVTVTTGEAGRYNDIPTTLNTGRERCLYVKWNDRWQPVLYGIDHREFNTFDSDEGEAQDPIQRWQEYASRVVDNPDSAAGSSSAAVAGPLTGTYQYYVAFVLNNGAETAAVALLSSSVTVAAKKIELTDIPVSEETVVVTARRLYRTNASTGGPYLLTTLEDNTTTTYSDIVPDASLGAARDLNQNSAIVEQFEIWPLGTNEQDIRFTGQKLPNIMVEDTDLCEIDGMLLAYSVAADELLRLKASEAPAKIAKATARFNKVRGTTPNRYDPINFSRLNKYTHRLIRRPSMTVVIAGEGLTGDGQIILGNP